MDIDHIFIFTDDNGKVADQLIEFGLSEGSSRVHVGQGTTNRKFYFSNFFLEILWVHNHNETKSALIEPTGLWQRANFKENNFSPFGLCLVNTDETNPLFENAYQYQPEYFPQGLSIDILKNDTQPNLPWTFRLPFKGQKKNESEPIKHENRLQFLTKTTFQYELNIENQFLRFFEDEKTIEFIKADKTWLNLTFDNGKQGVRKVFETLNLTIEF
jgi:Glyoxalase-like domain